MKAETCEWMKDILPPALLRAGRALSPRGWSGNYASWEEARRRSTGYDAAVILDRVRAAALKVKRGEAAFERDSVMFAQPDYSQPLLAGLLWFAALNRGSLTVLDFGGSLGSTYFQHRRFLDALPAVRWNVVEQKPFVECGRELFQDERLRFFETMAEAARDTAPSVALLSGVLQYLATPFAVLDEVMRSGVPGIIVDLTGFLETGPDRITVQRVPPTIYPASYPCWFFNRTKFLEFLRGRYELVSEFRDTIGQDIHLGWRKTGHYRGMVFRRRAGAA
jgi:putative methyltransferase (TIGR04325 family)